MSTITFTNAWQVLGQLWTVVGVVPAWAQGRIFVCPNCASPAVATDIYQGGRGDVSCIECAAGHVIERTGVEMEAVSSIIKRTIQAQASTPWPTGQNVYVTSDLWLTPEDGNIVLCRTRCKPRPVGLLSRNGGWHWAALPDADIQRAVGQLVRARE